MSRELPIIKTNLIAIDPGAGGGIAWVDQHGETHAVNMPEGMTAQCDLIRSLAEQLPGARCILEKVGGYMPGNSGPAAVKFARHCGGLDAACYMAGLSAEAVAPGVWMRSLGALPKDKADRKRKIKELMARRYPLLRVTLKTADALGILTWAGRR